MKTSHLRLLLILLAVILAPGVKGQTASFITTLGNDTLGIEQFTISPTKVSATVLLRSPRTLLSRQDLLLNADGSFQGYHSKTFEADQLDGEAIEEFTAIEVEDSTLVTHRQGAEETRLAFAYEKGLLPWTDMVHWPYELALRQMIQAGESRRNQRMLTGRSLAVFEIRSLGPDSVSIKHPFRGTMHARIFPDGGIAYYDATATTRKLIVRRGGALNMEAMAEKYAGKGLGELSGEGTSATSVHGASLEFTFGQPARRGRELFGGIVPWNQRWRTGANRATHFKTDRRLQFDGLEVPPGEYTLFTIPAPEGGTLIINTQTGQNGNSYDASMDLGRVPMIRVALDEDLELFRIDAVELPQDKGKLRLHWGNTGFEIPFTVAK